ncbi:MAG: membrane protein insertion efficiency factor YidD [Oscillospiraceae bacterium]|nr:membrane protein insertion efficiency factor YidD [Oscillospiraceae bacterium]
MKKIIIGLLNGYKRYISPCLPHSCRFLPTCSEYAMEAVEIHGVIKGSGLAVWRILRCNPFCKGGYDPVKP